MGHAGLRRLRSNSTYPTTFSLFNTGGSNQIGNYSNPTADKLINDSITSSDPAAVKAEAAFLTTDQPSMFEPNDDHTWAWKTTLVRAKPEAWENLTQYYATPGVLVLQLVTTPQALDCPGLR